MLGGAAGASPGGDDLLTVTVVRDEHGYGMKVSGDNPVYVQSVKEHGAAWRAGLRAGDRILCVDCVPVQHHAHQQVVHMIRANPSTALTVQQNSSRLKTPITAPVPVNPEKQRQLEVTKAHTVRLMLEQEQKYIRELKSELLKVPDVRKQAQLESSEQRCSILQHEIDNIIATQPEAAPSTPKLSRKDPERANSGFLSALPRSLSNLTGQSLRGLRQRARGEVPPPLPLPLPLTTCLDNTPPPLPPRRAPLPSPAPVLTPVPAKHKKPHPMHRSAPAYGADKFRRSSHSLDGEPEGPQPNSIALQLNYPLVNVPPPSLLTDNRSGIPILHVRSQSSPEHLDHEAPRTSAPPADKEWWSRGTPPPGTPPPPYHQPQPCADPQRAIISMEEDESPASDTSTHSGLFSNLRSVRESRARSAVLINWLLAERRCACAGLLLLLTDAYRAAPPPARSLRRWAYEIHSTFLMPGAVLQLNGVDENMANEIEHVLVNEHDKEELLRNVFRKARRRAKEELSRQLGEFQVKRQVGLATLYGPDDAVLQRCDLDKQQELVVVERIMCGRLGALAAGGAGGAGAAGGCGGAGGGEAHAALLAALVAAALCLHCRPACVAAAAGGARASFLQRDKLYKQRLKQIAKQQPQPFVVRGHHLQLQALTSVGHCHHCDHVIWGLAPQAYVCTDCKLRVHRGCARAVEEGCCLDGEHSNNRISRFMERIHPQPPGLDSSDKKSRKSSGTAHFLNMERSFRKMEDEPPPGDVAPPPAGTERRDESDESLYESADCHSDAISASDDALPRLGKTPTMSKESLKLAVTDEEGDLSRFKKGHRKAMSLSNPLEIVKNLGDEWLDLKPKETERNSDKKKSRESLWSEEDRESMYGSSMKLDKIRKISKKEDNKSNENSRKSSTTEAPKRKTSKVSSVSALNFLRRKKTPTSMKAVEAVVEAVDGILNTDEILNRTKFFLEEEKRFSAVSQSKPLVETDSDEEIPPPKVIGEHRRRLSRQTSRSKSKVRGKSQSVKVNTLRKTHSATLKKGKKKNGKNSLTSRSRQASIVDQSPILKKKSSDSSKQNSWLFSGSKGDARREGSTEEQTAPDPDADDAATREPEKENNSKGAPGGVNRAESCRERDAPRRWKHRNASDPNRLTAHHKHDLEPGAATAPSGSSSSSSLSSRSNESNTVVAEQQASQSDWSEEEDPLAAQWSESLPPHLRDSLVLSARIRKRQEVIHELIVSEGSHVRWLKVLGVDFLKPLERQPSLLPVDELRALFPNLPGVTNRHVKLYADLRAVRNEAPNHVVQIGPLAEAMLNTLGEAGYAQSLSRFCRGQRMALDALRERRRKNKDLQALLAAREQLPRCGRLQLRDLLACVWQRLTKYQLLLDSILRTVAEESEEDGAEEVARLRCALTVAKDVLHSVDTAIRTAENEHRLRSIQAKLEVRGAECEELRRLDLTAHSLRHEGELALRTDNKRTAVLALLLRDCLVLLQREGERYVLRPAQTGHAAPLSPLIKWDKVLFRPNAAVKNTFFLMNINGIQMHELSANTAAEYATWVRLIQEAPLARLAEAKPAHAHSRSTDDSGVNVSRNPSDASEKSTSSAPPTCENERDVSLDRDDKQDTDKPVLDVDENGDKRLSERDEDRERERSASIEKEEKHSVPAVGSSSTHTAPPPALHTPDALIVRHPQHAHLATRAYSHHERLRRLDEDISRALKAKSAVVAELLGVPAHSYTHLAELAVADTLGQVDICGEMHSSRESDAPADLHQLLLAAQAQANQLTESLSGAMSASEAARVAARAGRCDTCARRRRSEVLEESERESRVSCRSEADASYDMLADLSQEPGADAVLEGESAGCPLLAARLAGGVCGLQAALAALLAALPAVERERRELREELAVLRERLDARRDNHTKEDNIYPKGTLDQSIQEQPSNGG